MKLEADRTSGELIRERRKEVGVSQADLAWMARVSRGTISNVERSEGVPENRTFSNVAGALGLSHGGDRVTARATFPVVSETFTAMATGRIIELIKKVASEHESEGRRIADSFVNLVSSARGFDGGYDLAGVHQTYLNYLVKNIYSMLDSEDEVDASVLDGFRDRGWDPQDFTKETREPVSGESEPPREGLFGQAEDATVMIGELRTGLANLDRLVRDREEVEKKARAFDRLPLRLQMSLLDGNVVDSQIAAIPGGMAISLIVRYSETEVEAAATLFSLTRWIETNEWAREAFEILESQEFSESYNPLEVIDALRLAHASKPWIAKVLWKESPEVAREIQKKLPKGKFPDGMEVEGEPS